MHPNHQSLYSNLPPAMSATQQARAFASLEIARHALRSHLHKNQHVAQAIITHATAAVSGEEGTKNETKRYFEPKGPTAGKLQAYASASNPVEQCKALHALMARQAIYSECIDTLKEEQSRAKGSAPQGEGKSEAYFTELRALEIAYIEARNIIVTGNLRLVAGVASKHGRRSSFENEDLMQYGVFGLQKAVEAYKTDSGNKFSTYAVPSIRGEMTRAYERFAQEVRIPCHVWGKMRQYEHAQEELTYQLGRAPTVLEIAATLNIEVNEAEQLRQYHWDPVSIDALTGEEGEGATFGETLPDHSADFFNDYGDYADFIQPYLRQLEGLESEVLKKTIGYGFTRPMSVEEIAAEKRLSKETIREAFKSAVEKIATLRKPQSLAA